MLLSELYNSIIDEEKKGISKTSLKVAAKDVAITYSRQALKRGSAYLDYCEPQNRCAYLYKYAAVHTSLVTKFFRKLVKKKEIINILLRKTDWKISCLGGGPGTDIVGICKALSVMPHMHSRISQATILDLCYGWHHSFNHVIQNLISGKIKDIPSTFVKKNFKASFIEVDLLESLPTHVVEAVSKADVICMVKFVSAILGKKESLRALKVLADMFKVGAVVLFIDNFQGNVAESVEEISKQAGLKIILGPEVGKLHVTSKPKKELFGCDPQLNARVTVIGLLKTAKVPVSLNSRTEVKVDLNFPTEVNLTNCSDENNDEGWDTESEETESGSNTLAESFSMGENVIKTYCDKFTQTDEESVPIEIQQLSPLVTALSELVTVMTKLKLKQQSRCCRHSSCS